MQYGAAGASNRIAIRASDIPGGQHFKISAARIESAVGPVECEETFTANRDIKRIARDLESAGAEVRPLLLDSRQGGTFAAIDTICGVLRRVHAIEFTVVLVSAGAGVGQIISE